MQTIYIVDDSKLVRHRLYAELRSRTNNVIIKAAEDEDEFKADYDGVNPDIVITDLRLQKGSGFNILQFMQRKNKNPLRIVLSNYTEKPYKEKAFKMGANYYFSKSFEFSNAIKTVCRYLQIQKKGACDDKKTF